MVPFSCKIGRRVEADKYPIALLAPRMNLIGPYDAILEDIDSDSGLRKVAGMRKSIVVSILQATSRLALHSLQMWVVLAAACRTM